ncbi:hypothetical protein Y032_0102g3487 [Ancylostoma ceylanicum]|nr:hypothetical protein Y032_0102g3487 [Ancylostoma ceylanicum]
MHAVLGRLLKERVFCYLDNIMAVTSSMEEHLVTLGSLRVEQAGLDLNPKKCVLVEEKVEFLGHVIDRGGIRMDPERVEEIIQYPES